MNRRSALAVLLALVASLAVLPTAATAATAAPPDRHATAAPADVPPAETAPVGGVDATKLGKVSSGLFARTYPHAISAGPDGTIWLADAAGTRIQRYGLDGVPLDAFPTTSAVTRMVLGPDGNLWATGFSDNRIARITAAHDVTWFTDATISGPLAIVVGPDGALWFTNWSNDTIGRITTAGVVTNLAVDHLDHPARLTFATDGDLWVGNDNGYPNPGSLVHRRGDGTTTAIPLAGTQSGVMAMVADPDGEVWFLSRCDCGWGGILMSVDDADQVVSGLGPSPWLQDLLIGPDGALWVTDLGPFDPLTLPWNPGAILRLGDEGWRSSTTKGHGPGPMVNGPDGDVWFLNQGKDYLKSFGGPSLGRVAPAGDVSNFPFGAVDDVQGLAVDPSGNLWMANAGYRSNSRLAAPYQTAHVTTIAPRSITVTGDGIVFSTGPKVGAPELGGVARTALDGTNEVFEHPQLPDPASITAGPDGNAWFLTRTGGAIGRITAAGVMTAFADPQIDSGLVGDHDIVAGPDGNLWFANASSLGRMTPEGAVTTFAPDTGTIAPEQLAFDAAGNLWFTDAAHHALGRRSPAGAFTIVPDDRIVAPTDLAVGPDGASLWFTNGRDASGASIGYRSPTGVLSLFRDPAIGAPRAIVLGTDGDLWFADPYGGIRRIGTAAVPAVPSPPVGLTATPIGSRQIRVSWQTPEFEGSSPVTSYIVQMTRTDQTGYLGACVVGAATHSCTVTNLVAGKKYRFYVRALNAVGSSVLVGPGPAVVAPFLDIPQGAPFEADIAWMAERGITTGYGDGTFRPNGVVDRQSMAAFLARSIWTTYPPPCAPPSFTDVSPSSPFCEEIAYLKQAGIATGYPDGSFHPWDLVTREATAAFLYRAEHPGAPKPTCSVAPFTDVTVDHPFCGEIAWLQQSGIATGYEDGSFHPKATITRQAMAAFLHRFVELPA